MSSFFHDSADLIPGELEGQFLNPDLGQFLQPLIVANMETIPFDLDGNPRIVDGDSDGTATVDRGAYEHCSHAHCPHADVICGHSVNGLDLAAASSSACFGQ